MASEDKMKKIIREEIEKRRKEIGEEYIIKAEKWFDENFSESAKEQPAYEEVLLDIAEAIKEGKELLRHVYMYDLYDNFDFC